MLICFTDQIIIFSLIIEIALVIKTLLTSDFEDISIFFLGYKTSFFCKITTILTTGRGMGLWLTLGKGLGILLAKLSEWIFHFNKINLYYLHDLPTLMIFYFSLCVLAILMFRFTKLPLTSFFILRQILKVF